jgi:hypothetical protein
VSTERLAAAFRAETSEEAIALAKEWIRAEPRVRLRTIASCRPAVHPDGTPRPGVWTVEVVVNPKAPA